MAVNNGSALALGRSPHGERGLKCVCGVPVRHDVSRSPHGERGLKYIGKDDSYIAPGRSPHGERGLKLFGGCLGDGG